MSTIEKQALLEKFVSNFIIKSKRDRMLFELTNSKKRSAFIDRLNHEVTDIFEVNKLRLLTKSTDIAVIRNMLSIKESDLCYVICHDENFDDTIVNFNTTLNTLHRNGSGFVLIKISSGNIYIECEQVQGPADQYFSANHSS
ncbi:MAG TPA: hypothetical protein PLW44_16210 [Chitinophagales bacterium]|nr:hypothetical protein [Chitinophagales bacterium]